MTRAFSAGAFVLAAAFACAAANLSSAERTQLSPPETFATIGDAGARSVALFTEAGKVITSPRCINCHPAGDRPLQGASDRLHQPPVSRGPDGFGTTTLRCATCHQAANFDPAGIPGHPHWHLAPREMAWQGKSLGDICRQIKDPARNGNRSMAALLAHMAEDSLVGWAWNPGSPRDPAPGTQKEFGALLKAWIDTGAACPL